MLRNSTRSECGARSAEARARVGTGLVEDVAKRVEDYGRVTLESVQQDAREAARAAPGLDESEAVRTPEFFVKSREVLCEGRGEERAAFGARAVVARASPT